MLWSQAAWDQRSSVLRNCSHLQNGDVNNTLGSPNCGSTSADSTQQRLEKQQGKKLHKFSVNGKNLCEWNSDVIKM